MAELETQKLAAMVEERFQGYAEARRDLEDRWLECHYNVLGEYAPSVQGQWKESEKAGPHSKIFVRMTRQKVRSASQILAGMFSGNEIPFDLEVYPEVSDRIPPQALTPLEREIRRAHQMDRRQEMLLGLIWDAAEYGTGILRTDLVRQYSLPQWTRTSGGRWERVGLPVRYSGCRVVSPWYWYPDPEATSVEEGEGVVQYHRLYPHQIRALAGELGWDEEAVERALDKAATRTSGDNSEQHWESDLRQGEERGDDSQSARRWQVLEYWGRVPREELEEAGVEISEDAEGADLEACVVVLRGQVLKAAANPWDPARRPYLAFPWEPVPHRVWGVGLAENVMDAQRLANGAVRMYVAGKAFATSPMVEIDPDRLEPGQDLTSVYAGKAWIRARRAEPGAAIAPVVVPDAARGLLEMFSLFSGVADDASGLPRQMEGAAGAPSLNRTATGLSMVLGQANAGLRAVAQRLDDHLIEPMVERDLEWLLEHGDEALPRVPALVRASGTASVVTSELRTKRTLEFLQILGTLMQAGPLGTEILARVDLGRLVDQLIDTLEMDEVSRDPREASQVRQLLGGAQGAPGGAGPGGTPPGPAAGTTSQMPPGQELGAVFGSAGGMAGVPRVGG